MAKAINLVNETFGRLRVVEKAQPTEKRKRTSWRCLCECGNEIIATTSNLRSGNTTSCGCKRQDSNIKVKVGMTFGRLTVLARDGVKIYKHAHFSKWKCVCECGTHISVLGMSLMNGDTQSCGCLLSESARKNGLKTVSDLSGKRFGGLFVTERASTPSNGKVKWRCICSCGNSTVLDGNRITSGVVISCGCKRYKGIAYRKQHIRIKSRMASARRRASKQDANKPIDIEFFELVEEEAYRLAQKRTSLFGFDWHVDHIVPLKSDLVCGLHNEYNLAVIPATLNSKKGNRFWPNMP